MTIDKQSMDDDCRYRRGRDDSCFCLAGTALLECMDGAFYRPTKLRGHEKTAHGSKLTTCCCSDCAVALCKDQLTMINHG